MPIVVGAGRHLKPLANKGGRSGKEKAIKRGIAR
ncbi:MAG: hypothetical protein ACJATW_001627 [Glaciecola sp.]